MNRWLFKNGVIVLGALGVVALLQWGHPLNADEGVILNAAWKLYRGQQSYRDFFEYIAPGTWYLIYSVFKVCGPSYMAAKIVATFLLALSGWWAYGAASVMLRRSESIWLAIMWVIVASIAYPVINHDTLSAAGAALVVWYWMRWLKNSSWVLSSMIGGLSGAVFFVLQTKGIALVLCGVMYLAYEGVRKSHAWRHLAAFVCGVGAVVGGGIAYWGTGALTSFIAVSSAYLRYNEISYQSLGGYTALSMVIAVGAWHVRPEYRREIKLLACLHGALVLSTMNRPDITHLMLASLPSMILAGIQVEKIKELITKNAHATFLAWSAHIIGVAIVVLYIMTLARSTTSYEEPLSREIFEMVGSEGVVAWPFLPGLYFELKKDNPFPVSVSESLAIDPELEIRMVEILKHVQPRFAITNYADVEKFYFVTSQIDHYIAEHYIPVMSVGDSIKVLEKIP